MEEGAGIRPEGSNGSRQGQGDFSGEGSFASFQLVGWESPAEIVISILTRKFATPSVEVRDCRLDRLESWDCPRTELVKSPVYPCESLPLMLGCIVQICQVQVLQKMDGTKLTVPPIIGLGGHRESVADDLLDPRRIHTHPSVGRGQMATRFRPSRLEWNRAWSAAS